MTNCTAQKMEFPSVKKRSVEANFAGGDISSDGGVLLLGQVERKLGLIKSAVRGLGDSRRSASCVHSLENLLKQRVFGIALGYEDLNDHDSLRRDPLFQTAVGRDVALASSATLCRFENRSNRELCWSISKALVKTFIASYTKAPSQIILDFDATDDRVHGEQIGRSFHAYYGEYCFLPLYVFSGEHLLASYLRSGSARGHTNAWAILALLVKALRQAWPAVKIIYRGDSDFMTSQILYWCEKNRVDYIVAIKGNPALKKLAVPALQKTSKAFERTQEKSTHFTSVSYRAVKYEIQHFWPTPRRVLVKAECSDDGPSARFVITNMAGKSKQLYEGVYNLRGDMENRIKEQKLGLFSDRTSCEAFLANQLRLLISSLAYTLLVGLRRLALSGTDLAKAQCGTLRLKLLKIGAAVVRNTRSVRIFLSSSFPRQEIFFTASVRLAEE